MADSIWDAANEAYGQHKLDHELAHLQRCIQAVADGVALPEKPALPPCTVEYFDPYEGWREIVYEEGKPTQERAARTRRP